jgi:DNA-directed RNA polymerase subunit beta'
MPVYRNIRVEPTDDARSTAYPATAYQDAGEGYPFGQGSGEAVPLEDLDYGAYNR